MRCWLFGPTLLFAMLVAACSPAATPAPINVQVVPSPTIVQAAPTSPASTAAPTAAQPKAAATSPAPAPPSATVSGGGGQVLTVTSSAFTEGGGIPKKYSCDGSSVSPPLKWIGAPAHTASFVLIVDDPDAPVGTFTHWVAFDIPSTLTEIPEGAPALAHTQVQAKNVGKEGRNSAGRIGYVGPCPPSGTHRYIFTVYALDVPSLNLAEGASRDQVSNAVQGHVLAQGMLMGRYTR
jgi:Raf kinase inhibitor-like YbhB/YbcL family protein